MAATKTRNCEPLLEQPLESTLPLRQLSAIPPEGGPASARAVDEGQVSVGGGKVTITYRELGTAYVVVYGYDAGAALDAGSR